MIKIVIWGTGDRARFYMNAGYFKSCDIVGFVDNSPSERQYMGYEVYSPQTLTTMESNIDYIVIANEFYIEIMKQCSDMGISLDKLVLTDNIQIEPYPQYYMRLKEISPELFEDLAKRPSILVKRNEYDCVDDAMVLSKKGYDRAIYMEDYFRFRTFEFAAEQIKNERVPGDVAELGVFRGTFSTLINRHFSDRTLYLFDTFEGFESHEAADELSKGRCCDSFLVGHKDTTVGRAISTLPFPDKAKVCRGFFPDTVTAEAEKASYAFVSIDVDFEESTYQGLKFFYPRMSDGGMIFVHDYHTYCLQGIKASVARFEKENALRLKKIPIADKSGSLIIIK